jgi:arabinogalactan endo-1,4-beta-galactosidase
MMFSTKRILLGGLLCVLLVVGGMSIFAQSDDDERFYFGVDLSYVNEVEDCGAVYRVDGEPQDPFNLFAEQGANLVRARLWHNPDWTNYSTLADVKITFRRAQEAGMHTLLDFHYSDNWSDPSRQEIPHAWRDIDTVEGLADAVYHYTFDTLSDLHADGLTPDFVQVGNETNGGMLSDGGRLNWARQAQLFNAGIRGVRDFAERTNTTPQIILHIAQPENTGWWFHEAELAGITDFDVIGISYYPQWSVFSISDMGAHVSYLRQRFDKAVMIVETGYGWTRDMVQESADNVLNQGLRGYPFSPDGQRRFMQDLTQSLISNGALGVVYWEPAWVSTPCLTRWGQGSHWENATFFDFHNDNELLEGVQFLHADAYLYPPVMDGITPDIVIEDAIGDVLEGNPAFDLQQLRLSANEDWVFITLTIAGNIHDDFGNYLLYLDVTHDEQGADVDVLRRPITVADPYKPEFRLDITIREERGTRTPSYTLNAWVNEAWEQISYTGGASVTVGEPSVIALHIPRRLLGVTDSVQVAVISTNNGRANTAGDILGTEFTPSEWREPLVLDTFFSLPLGD